MAEHIAWLGMYDYPAQHAANDRLWQRIAEGLREQGVCEVPRRLARNLDTATAWSHPGLMFGQICTRPLALLHGGLQVLGHPVYAGTATPGTHRSRFVVRADDAATTLADLRGRRTAINDRGSNTGMALLRDAVAMPGAGRFFDAIVPTGSHRASARAVQDGDADLASLDEVSVAALARFDPAAVTGLRTIGWSAAAATPAFVTAATTPDATVGALRITLAVAMTDPALAAARDVLGITGLVPPQPGLIAAIVAREQGAGALA